MIATLQERFPGWSWTPMRDIRVGGRWTPRDGWVGLSPEHAVFLNAWMSGENLRMDVWDRTFKQRYSEKVVLVPLPTLLRRLPLQERMAMARSLLAQSPFRPISS